MSLLVRTVPEHKIREIKLLFIKETEDMKKGIKISGILFLLFLLAFMIPKGVHAEPSEEGCTGRSADGKHDWEPLSDSVIQPTCTEKGSITYQCARCGQQITEEIAALGHEWEDWVQTKAPTCEAEGEETRVCARTHHGGCNASEKRSIPALGHKWDTGTVTAEPSCTQPGMKVYTCLNDSSHSYQEEIPAKGHTPAVIPGTPATCTTPGLTDGQKCSVCGAVLQNQTAIAALGHLWNAGTVTTEPHGFEPGVRTYTCERDHSHTYTEEIAAAPSLFSKLRNLEYPDAAGKGPDFEITEQPKDGSCYRVGSLDKISCPLSVAVSGGSGNYHYEWHYYDALDLVSDTSDTFSALGSKAQEELTDLAKQYADAKKAAQGIILEAFKQTGISVFHDPTETNISEQLSSMNLNDKVVEGNDSPTINAKGNRYYYCIISDESGQKLTSEEAKVSYRLAITNQYVDRLNLTTSEKKELYCEAIDGKKPYTYDWFYKNAEGAEEQVQTETIKGISTLPVDKVGEYYCVVSDAEGDKATARPIKVYEAEPLELLSETMGEYILPGVETAALDVTVTGGTPPYHGNWSSFEADRFEDQDPVQDADGSWHFRISTDQLSFWTLYVEDSIGDWNSIELSVAYRELFIGKESEDCMLPAKGGVDIFAELEEGEGTAPFHYELYTQPLNWDDTDYEDAELVEESTSSSFHVEEAGTYYIKITDSQDRWARSRMIHVSDYDFQVLSCPETVQFGEGENVALIDVVLQGGKAPYEWTLLEYNTGIHDFIGITGGESSDTTATMRAYRPGTFVACFTDSNGAEYWTRPIKVQYSGVSPLIIEQPLSGGFQLSKESLTNLPHTFELSCKAVLSESYADKKLLYRWYKKSGDASGVRWEWVADGRILYLEESGALEDKITGTYMCEVVIDEPWARDPFNALGKSYSDEATVSINMCVTRVEQKKKTIEVDFYGGGGPYTIQAVHLCEDDLAKYFMYEDTKWEKEFIKPDSLVFNEETQIMTATFKKIDRYKDVYNKWSGLTSRYGYTYYFRITDCIGYVVETKHECQW